MRGQTLLWEHVGTTDGSPGNVAGEQKSPLPGQKPQAAGSTFKSRGCTGCTPVVCRHLGASGWWDGARWAGEGAQSARACCRKAMLFDYWTGAYLWYFHFPQSDVFWWFIHDWCSEKLEKASGIAMAWRSSIWLRLQLNYCQRHHARFTPANLKLNLYI